MKTINCLLIEFVLFAALVGCEKEKIKISVDSFVIEYIKGSSWVDYEYSVNLDQTGIMHVKYHQTDYYRENYYQIDNANLEALKEELASLLSINLNDEYGFGENKPTDLPVTFYRYQTNIRSDSTYIYFPEENELPYELHSYIDLLNQIIIETDTLLGNNS